MKKNDETIIGGFEQPDLGPDERALFGKLPTNGSAESHHALRQSLGWDDLRFWKARDSLIEKGYITSAQGKGGNFYRRIPEPVAEAMEEEVEEVIETKMPSLHTPSMHTPQMHSTSMSAHTTSGVHLKKEPLLSTSIGLDLSISDLFISGLEKWALENQFSNYFIEALKGNDSPNDLARYGKRPDVMMVSVETFQFVPNKHMEIFSYCVRKSGEWSLDATYEAAGHLRFSNRSYLALQKDLRTGAPAGLQARIEEECRRLGVGLIVCEDPSDYSTFQIRLSPLSIPFNPREVERRMETLSEESRAKLIRWLR
jgi:hypothetical protein